MRSKNSRYAPLLIDTEHHELPNRLNDQRRVPIWPALLSQPILLDPMTCLRASAIALPGVPLTPASSSALQSLKHNLRSYRWHGVPDLLPNSRVT